MSATQAATWSRGRRVVVQVPLVQPHRADVHRRAPRAGAVGAEDQLGRAAADVDDEHRAARAASRRSRVAPSKTSAASSSPDSTSGATPSRSRTPAVKTSALRGVAGRRGGAEADPGRRRGRAISAAYSSTAANVRASASSASRPVASTPCPSRTIRDSRTDDRRGRSPIRSLMVLVPQSIAAILSHGARHAGPSAHHVARAARAPRRRAGSRPARRPAPGAASDVQALDPVGHPAGGDAGDLRHVAELGAGGEVGVVRGGVRRGELGVRRRAGPPSPASAPSPRGCRSATPRAGRSGSTSSGTACRRAAAAR